MKNELNMDQLNEVLGGNAYINANTMKMAFDTIDGVFKLTNCTADQAAALCKSFIGKCATVEEYDQACYNALKSKGWI